VIHETRGLFSSILIFFISFFPVVFGLCTKRTWMHACMATTPAGWHGTLWSPTSKQQARKEASFLLCTLFQRGSVVPLRLQADRQTRRPSFLRLRALLCSLGDFLLDWMELDRRGKKIEEKKWLDLGNSRQGGFGKEGSFVSTTTALERSRWSSAHLLFTCRRRTASVSACLATPFFLARALPPRIDSHQ
jgi:hypothetical protein